MGSFRHIAASALSFARAGRGERRARRETFLLDRIIRRPIVYTDDRGLRYVLYPNENAGAYIWRAETTSTTRCASASACSCPARQCLTSARTSACTHCSRVCRSTGWSVHAFEPETGNAGRLAVNIALTDSTTSRS